MSDNDDTENVSIDENSCLPNQEFWDQNDAYSLKMKKIQGDLKSYARKLKRPLLFNFDVILHPDGYAGPEEDNLDNLILYDKTLFPYWREFSTALCECNDRDIVALHVDSIQLSKNVLDILTPALKTKKLRYMTLRKNNFGSDGIAFVSNFLECNSSLNGLEITDNSLDDLVTAKRFSDMVGRHPVLEDVILKRCNIGKNAKFLSFLLSSLRGVRMINLSGNHLRTEGAISLSRFLETNPGLNHIWLHNNGFTDSDAILFAKSLKKNDKLQLLSLLENDFTPLGEKILHSAIFDTSSLNAVYDSNHTCELRINEDCRPSHNSHIEYNQWILGTRRARRRKIFLALTRTETKRLNFCYLEDVPVELMPYMLESLQLMSNLNSSLPFLFEILRNWKMPALYDFKACPKTQKRKRFSSDYGH